MSRPRKCRRVAFMPGVTYFKPAGIPLRLLAENRLSYEETEAVRLRDIEGLEQAEGASRMNISRPTYQRLLAAARRKIADSLINGKALRIDGGDYEYSAGAETGSVKIQEGTMKIAVITEDENSVSQHFGRAPWYEVFTVEDGKITGREKRAKMGHQHFAGQGGAHHEQAGAQHGFDEVSHGRHAGMASAIQDCSVLIAGGMGMGAFASLQSFNIQAVITDETDARKAVERYVAGSLPNLKDRLH